MIKSLLPQKFRKTLRNYKILSSYLGQYKSMRLRECVDRNGTPIPWYTYPAIEYIRQLDFSDKIIFEYGSGNSTRFWAGRCKKIVSIEHNKEWYNKIKNGLPGHVEYHLLEEAQEYIKSINNYSNKFDVIVIDGMHRYKCAIEALGKLRDNGFIILDNSDWYEKTSKLLRDSDLIEVDMSGFAPINGHTHTTSFYFRRNVKLRPASDRQPMHGIGSLNWSLD